MFLTSQRVRRCPRARLPVARTIAVATLSALLAACTHAGPPLVVPEPSLPWRDEPRELAVDQQAKHALDRLTYGARPGEATVVTREGLDRWLVRQLTPENWPDRTADSALAGFAVMTTPVKALVDASPQQDVFVRRRRAELGLAANAPYVMSPDDSARYKMMSDLGNRRVQEILGAKMMRAVMSEHQLQEVLTDFWENHFSVFRGKMPTVGMVRTGCRENRRAISGEARTSERSVSPHCSVCS